MKAKSTITQLLECLKLLKTKQNKITILSAGEDAETGLIICTWKEHK